MQHRPTLIWAAPSMRTRVFLPKASAAPRGAMQAQSIYRSRSWLAAVMLLLVPALASAQTTYSPPRITSAIDNASRVAIPHSTHPLAVPAFDVGPLDGSTPMQRMILMLDGSADQDYQLSVLLDSQQTQTSPEYHHWLTPDEFGRQFGPAPQDIQVISGWLEQQGFSVDKVARSGRWIEFSGTAAQVETAFQTQMRRYQVRGEAHVANSTDISIPAALAPVVRGVASLHNFFSKPMLSRYFGVQRNAQVRLRQLAPTLRREPLISCLQTISRRFTIPRLCSPPAPTAAARPLRSSPGAT